MRRGPFGCVFALFTAFCGILFVGVLIELAGFVVALLGIALAVIALGRIAIGVQYALKHGRPTKEDE